MKKRLLRSLVSSKGYYKKVLRPRVKSEVVKHLMNCSGLSIRKACKLAQLPRSTFTYIPKENNDQLIIGLIQDILSKPTAARYG